jgi:acyl-CoA thioester hydrolase
MASQLQPARPSRSFAYHLPIVASLRDTDGLGHVNNAVYVNWLEEVRTLYVYERRGLTKLSEIDFILASTRLEFKSPVLLHETVDMWCAPSRIGNSSWDMEYEGLARSDGRVVMQATSVQVQFDYKLQKPAPIQEPWKKILEADLLKQPIS